MAEYIRYNLPDELIEEIISYCFDRRGYHFLHYYMFQKNYSVQQEWNNYVKHNHWFIYYDIIPMFHKMIDLKELKNIKRTYKTIDELKNHLHFHFWKKYY